MFADVPKFMETGNGSIAVVKQCEIQILRATVFGTKTTTYLRLLGMYTTEQNRTSIYFINNIQFSFIKLIYMIKTPSERIFTT